MTTAKTASAKTEALDAPVSFEYDGETYEIPKTLAWDLDVLEAYEDGRVLACVRALLGDEAWKRYRAKPRTVGDLTDLFEALQGALGLGN